MEQEIKEIEEMAHKMKENSIWIRQTWEKQIDSSYSKDDFIYDITKTGYLISSSLDSLCRRRNFGKEEKMKTMEQIREKMGNLIIDYYHSGYNEYSLPELNQIIEDFRQFLMHH